MENRKARRAGRPEVPPLYEMNDALGVLEHFEGYNYDEIVEVNDEGFHPVYGYRPICLDQPPSKSG